MRYNTLVKSQIYFIKTFGCQMNEADSQRLAAALTGQGHRLTSQIDQATVVVINTCSVREAAENRVFGLVEKLAKLSAKSYQPKTVVYEIPRRNFYLGQEVHYGGAWPDYVKRLFFKNTLQRWERDLHEDPVFAGQMGTLRAPLVHLAHRDLSSMIAKTSEWSQIEANLLFQSGHPPVTWWRLLRPMLTEFWQRGVVKQGWRDGPIGWIEVIFQAFSRFITYARLWEMQQKKL